MLRDVNPNVNAVGVIGPAKTFSADSIFIQSPSNSPLPAPAKAFVSPISPSTALAELEAVRQRLLVLVQGISAWNALPIGMLTETCPGEPSSQEVLAKLRENEVLFDQCRVLQGLQQHLSTAQGAVLRPVSGCTQGLRGLFAPPQMVPPVSATAESPRSSPLSNPSCEDQASPALLDDADALRPNERLSLTCASLRSAATLTSGDAAAAGKSQTVSGSRSTARPVAGSGFVRRVAWPPQRDCVLAIVEFKRQRMKRCLCEAMIDPGKYVIIPGDRGYDCGLVIQCGHYNTSTGAYETDSLRTMDAEVVDPERLKGDMIPVMREATADEVQQLYSTQASKERLALKRCRDLVKRLGLDMNVVDCEYQFDGTKISFYFEASHSIDFRELNKELYRIFNARIWLENVNNAVKNVVPEGAISKSDKAQFKRSGLRLPVRY